MAPLWRLGFTVEDWKLCFLVVPCELGGTDSEKFPQTYESVLELWTSIDPPMEGIWEWCSENDPFVCFIDPEEWL